MSSALAIAEQPAWPSPIETALADIKRLVPNAIRAVVVLLPDGLQLGAFGETHAIDYEPLVRACTRCFSPEAGSLELGEEAPRLFTEYYALTDDGLVVMQRRQRESRIALAVVCALDVNLALVLTWTRTAIDAIEASIDLADFDL